MTCVPSDSNVPEPMSEAEIMYADVALSRLRDEANIMGGVISPASIASACCNPHVIARRRGSSCSSA